MKILIKFPSRGRPDQFKKVLKLYRDKLENPQNTKFVFSFDVDDFSMNNLDIINFINELNINHEVFYGNNKNKIEAINANLENQFFDILILASDDMIPVVDCYDTKIIEYFQNSNLGLDCMLHTQSTRWSDLLDINCIMGWDYFKRFGYIYHSSYKSIFADNEYTEISKMLGRNVFTPGFCPFFHDWKGGDETEIKNFQFNNEDNLVYEERRKNNFFITSGDTTTIN
jgi:hypothetical protein